jgi:hypothetical protein
VAFPKDPLDLKVELFVKGAWHLLSAFSYAVEDYYTDVYEDVYLGRLLWDHNRFPWQPIRITRGRADEAADHAPATVSMRLWNEDGYLTPHDPRSPWFPDVAVGAPLRVTVDGADTFEGELSEIALTWPHGDLSKSAAVEVGGVPVLVGDVPVTIGSPSGGIAYAEITAAGILRRLAQGQRPLRSPLARLVTAPHNLAHVDTYWPMEDGALSGSAAALVGAHQMDVTAMRYASSSFLAGSDPVVSGSGYGAWEGLVDGTAAPWTVEQFFHVPPIESGQSVTLMHVTTTGTVAHWLAVLEFDSTTSLPFLAVRGYTAGWIPLVNATTNSSAALALIFDTVATIWLTLEADGSWSFVWYEVGGEGLGFGGASLGPPGVVRRVAGRLDNTTFALGHVIVHHNVPGGWIVNGAQGWVGETALTRYRRLCAEERVPAQYLTYRSLEEGVPMGVQTSKTFLELVRECADAEQGILCEAVASPSLVFRTRLSRHNRPYALSLSAADNGIANPFLPVADDLGIVNDVTVQRAGGSSRRYIDPVESLPPPAGRGLYDASYTLSLEHDDLALDAAGWFVRLGTHKGMRYPKVTIDLGIRPDLKAAVLAMRPGDRIEITDLPPQHPRSSVDLHVEGWTDERGPHSWTRTLNCSPAEPWTVAVWDESVYDTSGSELAVGVDADDTTISVTTLPGDLWAVDVAPDAAYPFDLLIGGAERVTAMECTGGSSPQTMTIVRATDGTARAHTAGSSVHLADRPVFAR